MITRSSNALPIATSRMPTISSTYPRNSLKINIKKLKNVEYNDNKLHEIDYFKLIIASIIIECTVN